METVEQQKPTQTSKNQIPKGIGKETSQERKENKNNMANKETMILPDFVEEPNIKNEGMEYEEIEFDPYDSANGELVDKNEVTKVDTKAIHKLLAKVGDGIL